MLRKIRQLLKPLNNTPFHPQWLVNVKNTHLHHHLKKINDGQTILDIGCFDKWPKEIISSNCSYIGLDYYETANMWYNTVPDVYGDALRLPIKTQSIDTVLLLDVLEHLSNSTIFFQEAGRVLKTNGKLIIRVPFLYPLHDEPRDFFRITSHGFEKLAEKHNFLVEECNSIGHPVETSSLLTNIAISKTIIEWIKNKNPVSILIVFLPVIILVNNLLAKSVAMISKEDHFMPISYQVILKKKE